MRRSFNGAINAIQLFLVSLSFMISLSTNAMVSQEGDIPWAPIERVLEDGEFDPAKDKDEWQVEAEPKSSTQAPPLEVGLDALKATVNASRGLTRIYLALFLGDYKRVKALLAKGALVNEESFYNGSLVRERNRKSVHIDELKKKKPEILEKPSSSSSTLKVLVKNLLFDKPSHQTKSERLPRKPVALEPIAETSTDVQEVLGNVFINGETPIFIIAKKEEPTATDYKIAQKLFTYGAKIDISAALTKNLLAPKKTPLEILEDRMREQASTRAVSISPRKAEDDEYARKNFLKALADRDIKVETASIWFLFADGYLTTDLVESYAGADLHEIKNSLLPFLNGLAHWELDTDLPEPPEAFDRYERIKHLLSDKMRFNMLLKYRVLRSKEMSDLSSRAHLFTFNDVKTQTPVEVAKAIHAVQVDQFLRIESRHVGIKAIRLEESRSLRRFLRGMSALPNLVAYSIVSSDDPAEQFLFWRTVAERLFSMNNLFGTWCIYSGLHTRPVTLRLEKRDYGKLPNLQSRSVYLDIIKKRDDPFIPAIIHEFNQLSTFREAKATFGGNLVGAGENTLAGVAKTVLGCITSNQKKLRSVSDVHASTQLYNYFSRIPPQETNENAALLWALVSVKTKDTLSAKSEKKPAEYWDTQRLAAWLISRGVKEENVLQLLNNGITDGPTFIEKYALVHHSLEKPRSEHELAELFLSYDGWLVQRDKKALQNLDQRRQFPVNLWSDPQSTFQWIMWLRNNGLAEDALPQFLGNNILNFSTFVNLVKNDPDAITALKISPLSLAKLKHAANLYLKRHVQPSDMSEWQIDDIEIWLHEKGLTNLIPTIAMHKAWSSDQILSYLYFAKKFGAKSRKPLGEYRYPWVSRLSEALPANFVKLVENSSNHLNCEGADLKTSNLFFIRMLISIGASHSILPFYIDKIRTVNQLSLMLRAQEPLIIEQEVSIDDSVEDSGSCCNSSRSVDSRTTEESTSGESSTRSVEVKALDVAEFIDTTFNEQHIPPLEQYGINEEQREALSKFLFLTT